MDYHVHGNPRPHYRLNGYRQTKDDGLQFLSMEEKECILFFEETIDALDEGFNDENVSSRKRSPADGLRTPSNSMFRSPGLMEHDIIDLVHSPSNFSVTDFQSLSVTPEPYYETRVKRDPVEGVVPSQTAAHDENIHQPPPGSVPTPVVIASKIAEHRGTGGITPSALLSHRRSLESKREPARAPRLPSKISMTHGNSEPSPHSLATAAVNIQERRSQVLANLPSGSHPLEGGEPSCVRNAPTRSVSFKDLEPEKSRMEALSKLGLTGGKTTNLTANVLTRRSSSNTSPNNTYVMSSSDVSPVQSPPVVSNSGVSAVRSPPKVRSSDTSASNSAYKLSNNASRASSSTASHVANKTNTSSNIPDVTIGQRKTSNPPVPQPTSSISYEPKPRSEISSNFNYYGGKSAQIASPSKDAAAPVTQDRRSSLPPTNADVKQTNFNSYGGKSLVLNPTTNVKEDSISSPSADATDSAETQFNSYGGRSRSFHPFGNVDVSEGTKSNNLPTRTISPATHHGDSTRFRYPPEQNSSETKPSEQVNQPPVRSRHSTVPPPTSSKPQGFMRPRPDPVPPEILSKPAPSFRTQGITVQFSGKGTTGEARRDALRRLGLLNNTS